MTQHVFTYGSLMFAQVWTRVVAGRYDSVAATLSGHARYQVSDETYPGMVVSPNASVVGVLHLDVDGADLDRLDRFEGDDYARCSLAVIDDLGVERVAETYLYLRPDRLLKTSWDPERFEMQRFLDTYCRDRLGPGTER